MQRKTRLRPSPDCWTTQSQSWSNELSKKTGRQDPPCGLRGYLGRVHNLHRVSCEQKSGLWRGTERATHDPGRYRDPPDGRGEARVSVINHFGPILGDANHGRPLCQCGPDAWRGGEGEGRAEEEADAGREEER